MLRGIDGVTVFVGFGNDRDAAECGLSKDAISNAVKYVFSSARFKVGNPPLAYGVDISILKLNRQEECVYNIRSSAFTFEKLVLSVSGTEVTSRVMLWEDPGTIGIWPKSTFTHEIIETTEQQAKNFVKDWNLDNK